MSDGSTQPAIEHHVGTLDLSGEGNRAASMVSDEAIALAAQAFYGGAYLVPDSEMNDLLKQGARAALEAAYPAIREQVAEEIAAKADAIAEGYSEAAKIQRQLSIDKGGSRAGGASNMRTALAFKNRAAGASEVAHEARYIGERGGNATAPGQAVGADLTAGANADPSDPREPQALSKRLPGVEG